MLGSPQHHDETCASHLVVAALVVGSLGYFGNNLVFRQCGT
jgi:hypothetical protein